MYNATQCAMQRNGMQRNAMQCNAMQCSAMQCNAIYNAMYIAMCDYSYYELRCGPTLEAGEILDRDGVAHRK